MGRKRSLCGVARCYLVVTVAAVVVMGVTTGLVSIVRAQTDQASKPGHVLLNEDLLKLGIVVMANQTPITQADAQAVLPVLEKIQTHREQGREPSIGPDDAAAAALDVQLLSALSPKLQDAVGVVRLLTPQPIAGRGVRGGGPGAIGDMNKDQPGPPPGGPGRGPRGSRGPHGMMGPWMLEALIDFFRSTAGG